MSQPRPTSLTPAVLLHLLTRYSYLWILPAIAGFALAAGYTLVTPQSWSASQGLIVRNDAAGYTNQRLGKFTDLAEMKTVQETMLELARSQSVVSAALTDVGPSKAAKKATWPSRKDIEDFREKLTITPPGGAEFGITEVFYIQVKDTSPDRARKLVAALANQLEKRLQMLRSETAGSMVSELEQSVAIAEQGLEKEVGQVAAFESKLGAQLSELRFLVSTGGTQSLIEQQAVAIENELREINNQRQKSEKLLYTLSAAKDHPDRLLAIPSSLLSTTPYLLSLKDGLVKAQIHTASLLGSRSAEHPFVLAAEATESKLREEINQLAPQAIHSVEMELSVLTTRQSSLQTKLTELRQEQANIASHRAQYAKLLAGVENQTRVVDTARAQLADAQAHFAGVQSASVLARLDIAESGIKPNGPGRTIIAAAGGVFGLLAGMGAVLFFYGPQFAPQNLAGPAGSGVSVRSPGAPGGVTAANVTTPPFGFSTTASPFATS